MLKGIFGSRVCCSEDSVEVIAVYLGAAGMIGYEALMGGERERTTLEYVVWAAGGVIAMTATTLIAIKAKKAVEQATGR